MRRVGVRELRGNLTSFLRMAQQGQAFLVMSRDKVLAAIHPPPVAAKPQRRPGLLRGAIEMTDDFDPLPADMLSAMER